MKINFSAMLKSVTNNVFGVCLSEVQIKEKFKDNEKKKPCSDGKIIKFHEKHVTTVCRQVKNIH